MIALGIDPGTRRLGWGVVARAGNRLSHVAHGVIALGASESIAARLVELETQLTQIIREHRPNVSSVESLFFSKDAQAAAKLGHARGVVLLCLARERIPIAEYAPAKVKRTIAGSGMADKRQVALLVRAALALDSLPESDAADALAIAITHLRLGGLLAALAEAERCGREPSDRARMLASMLGARRGRKPVPSRP